MGSILGIFTVLIFLAFSLFSITSISSIAKLYLIYSYAFLILISINYHLSRPDDDDFLRIGFLKNEFSVFKKYHSYFKYKGASEIISQYINFSRAALILIAIYFLANEAYIAAIASIAFYFVSSGMIFLLNPVIYLIDKKNDSSSILLEEILSIQKKNNLKNENSYASKMPEDNNDNSHATQDNKVVYFETLDILFASELYPEMPKFIKQKFTFNNVSENPIITAINDATTFVKKMAYIGSITTKNEVSASLLVRVKYGLTRLVAEKKIDFNMGLHYWSELYKLENNGDYGDAASLEFLTQIEFALGLGKLRDRFSDNI